MKPFYYWISYGIGYVVKAMWFGYHHGKNASESRITTGAKERKVIALLKADPENNYIPAIKLYRELMGATLLDAKNTVEAMRDRMLRS